MIRVLLALLVCFAITAAIMPWIIKLSYKLKVRQTILHYVDNHQSKSGTPTMGGIGFLIALAITCLCFMKKEHSLMLITLIVTVGYGIVGFLDDFIKIFFKRNEGLSPLQKIVFQLLIAVIVSIFAYNNPFIGDSILIPLSFIEVRLGIFVIPLFIFVFIAYTNAVNLTDGIDGLAAGNSLVFVLFFGLFIYLAFFEGGQTYSDEYISLLVYCAALAGGLLGFLCYNGFPAKVFMGDTGALALGGGLACLSVVSKQILMAPIIGIMFVLTALSVMIQVGYFKMTKKRVFLMAPLHHHFERKGIHETKIVRIYLVITALVGVLCLIGIYIFRQ